MRSHARFGVSSPRGRRAARADPPATLPSRWAAPGGQDLRGSSPALPSYSGFAAEPHFGQNGVARAFRRFVAARAARCLSRPAGDLALAMGCPGRPGFAGVVSRVAELRLFCRRAACAQNAFERAFRRCVAAGAARAPRPAAPRQRGPRDAPSPPGTRGLALGVPCARPASAATARPQPFSAPVSRVKLSTGLARQVYQETEFLRLVTKRHTLQE